VLEGGHAGRPVATTWLAAAVSSRATGAGDSRDVSTRAKFRAASGGQRQALYQELLQRGRHAARPLKKAAFFPAGALTLSPPPAFAAHARFSAPEPPHPAVRELASLDGAGLGESGPLGAAGGGGLRYLR